MDKTNQWKTAPWPLSDDNDDVLARRLIENWTSSASHRGRSGDQIVQKLRDGRVRVIEVESTRSRRRSAISRS